MLLMIAQASLVLVRLPALFASVRTRLRDVQFAMGFACSVPVEAARGGIGFAAFVAGEGAKFFIRGAGV